MDNIDRVPDEPRPGVWVVHDPVRPSRVRLFWSKEGADKKVIDFRIKSHNYRESNKLGCPCGVEGVISDASACSSNIVQVEHVIPHG